VNKTLTFTISVPTDNGFIGRACNNPECGQYFKIFAESRKDPMYCPYCGSEFHESELHTEDQVQYLTEAAKAEALAHVQGELQNMLKRTFGTTSARKSGISFRPGKISKKVVTPRYVERKVDSELECPSCGTKFQVYGVFGHCPGCKEENMLVYDANFNIIEKEISQSKNPERGLRHAYGDLVSTFENFCKRKAKNLTTESARFQVLFDARKFFKTHAGTDILSHIDPAELLALRRLFMKRHLYTHSDGTITEEYIHKIPEDKNLLGQKAPLSIEELKLAAFGMRIALLDLVKVVERKG
jgi:DNA-directed RNA polymerase subunit RPC12/RpoP